MKKPGDRILLGSALALLLAARVVYFLQVREHPLFQHPAADAAAYDALARRIASGDGYPLPVFATSPFYPYLLALFYRVFGATPSVPVLFQLLLGLGSGVLLYDIGRRLGGAWAGTLALLVGGLYAPALFHEGLLLPTAAGIFANLLLLALLLRYRPGGSRARLLGAGLLLGLGTLVQGNSALFLPLLIGWLLAAEPKKRRRSAAGALLLGFAIAIAPVTARNLVRGKDLVFVSSHLGIDLYMGNNAKASGVFSFPDEPIVLSSENVNIYDSKRIAEAAAGKSLKPSRVSSYWTRRALSWIRDDPAAYFALLGKKTALFWNDLEIPDNADLYFFEERLPVLRWTPFFFGVVAPLGVFGLGFLLGGRKGRLVALFLAAQFASVLIFYTHSRYRIPFAVMLAAPAACGAVTLAKGLRRWSFAARLWALGALALLVVLFNAPLYGKGRAAARGFSLTHLANGLLEMGRGEEAEAAYREALRVLPGHPVAHYGLGRLYQIAGSDDKAALEYLAAVRAIPSFAEARLNLGTAYHALGENEKALAELREAARLRPEWPAARYNLGNTLSDLGRPAEAEEQYRLAEAEDPGNADIVRNLSNVLERKGDLLAAEETLRRGIERMTPNADLRNRLGDLLEKQGRPDEAMQEYEQAVAIDSRHSAAWNNIGLLRFHRGETDAAIDAWRTILAYDPESPVTGNIRMAEEARTQGREGGSR